MKIIPITLFNKNKCNYKYLMQFLLLYRVAKALPDVHFHVNCSSFNASTRQVKQLSYVDIHHSCVLLFMDQHYIIL